MFLPWKVVWRKPDQPDWFLRLCWWNPSLANAILDEILPALSKMGIGQGWEYLIKDCIWYFGLQIALMRSSGSIHTRNFHGFLIATKLLIHGVEVVTGLIIFLRPPGCQTWVLAFLSRPPALFVVHAALGIQWGLVQCDNLLWGIQVPQTRLYTGHSDLWVVLHSQCLFLSYLVPGMSSLIEEVADCPILPWNLDCRGNLYRHTLHGTLL